MNLHREGYKIIFISTLILVGIVYGLSSVISQSWLLALIFIPVLVFYILVIRFFRNPPRFSDKTQNGVVSPCDGKVVVIEEVEESEYFKDKRIQLSIFMSPLNVHVNRNPISGIVNYFKYHPGKYLVAWHPKSSTENERTTTVIKTDQGVEVLFRQIAGAVARRIRWYVKPNDKATQGNEMGFIKFGSRVDVFVPVGTEINVEIGQKVKAAESLLGVLK
ncbi:MAG: phosphatidylserine decarboxylase family protein [Bacteroidia bacterium]|nr:phosphatidylserine decarboxylase family protein [Bacteroidia bacterium]|tara:strand:+ start:1204 stop:1860 length:657 start_codon:yes stop_codon:yes gene_type:complete